MDLILARKSGAEVAVMPWKADFECGGSNTFEIEIPKRIWQQKEGFYDLVYVPGTEFGGMIGEILSEREPNSIFLRGDTWRGMISKKIVIPDASTHYYKTSGNSRECIRRLLLAFFKDPIIAAANENGVNTEPYQLPRYCDLLTGINGMLGTVAYKARIWYQQTAVSGYIAVGAAPVRSFRAMEEEVEIRSDVKRNGINHLICLGSGELANRLVRHIYTDQYGNIVSKKTMTGRYENAAVYNNTGAETAEELIKGGTEYLQALKSEETIEMTSNSFIEEHEIGDIVMATDPISGQTTAKKIERKILTITGGIPRIEYKMEGEA